MSKTVKAKVDSGKSKPAKTAKPELVTKSDVTKGATPVAIDSDSSKVSFSYVMPLFL